MSCNTCGRISPVTSPVNTNSQSLSSLPATKMSSCGNSTLDGSNSVYNVRPAITNTPVLGSQSVVINDCVQPLVAISSKAQIESISNCECSESECQILPCENEEVECSEPAKPKLLDFSWLMSRPVDKMTILGRVGKELAKLKGEGVLWHYLDGKVGIVKQLPLKVSHLYHTWFNQQGSSPIMSEPLPYPYKVIADEQGTTHGIAGLTNEDSIERWNHSERMYEQVGVSELPVATRSKLPTTTQIELTGFTPVATSEACDTLRELKRLSGQPGIIITKEIDTCPTQVCDCDTQLSTGEVADKTMVAELLPYPTNSEDYFLCYGVNGVEWKSITSIVSSGDFTGAPGADGAPGAPGADGADGTVTTYNAC